MDNFIPLPLAERLPDQVAEVPQRMMAKPAWLQPLQSSAAVVPSGRLVLV